MLKLIILLLYCLKTINNNLIYPIAFTEKDNNILICYEKDDLNKELWSTQIDGTNTKKIIFSAFVNSVFKMLPSNLGFSFINNNKLRIKYFQKRSSKSIVFDNKLYDFDNLEWLSDNICFFSARRFNRNVIMISDINNYNLRVIEENNLGECLKPQKIADNLFYINKYGNFYTIVKTFFLNPFAEEDQNIDFFFKEENERQQIIDFTDKQILNIKLVSNDEVYFLKVEEFMLDDKIKFSYNQIKKENLKWSEEKMFDFYIKDIFNLKINKFQDKDCFYLPQHYSDKIYFTDLADVDTMNIFEFDLNKKDIKQKTFKTSLSHVFAPLIFKNNLYYGKCLSCQDQNLIEQTDDMPTVFASLFFEKAIHDISKQP